MTKILITDSGGQPREWAGTKDAACYYARDKVLWGLGSIVKTYLGGKNCDGEQSRLDIPAIMCVTGPLVGKRFYSATSQFTERAVLYGRDRHLCGYCGYKFTADKLTIDHIIPRSRQGKNIWMNTVSACKPCNLRKAARTPEEAKMPLLYVPYIPNMFEKMILRERNILTDQMEFLMSKVPKNSRLLAS